MMEVGIWWNNENLRGLEEKQGVLQSFFHELFGSDRIHLQIELVELDSKLSHITYSYKSTW